MSQWTEQMIQANNIIVDTGNHLVARGYPYPTKFAYCNQNTNNTLNKLVHANLTVLFNIKTPTIIVSYVKRLRQLLIYSPDSVEQSEVVNLFKKQITTTKLAQELQKQNYSLVFQLNNQQFELITAVANTYQGKLNVQLAKQIATKLHLAMIKTEDINLNSQNHAKQFLARKVGQLQLHHANSIISIDNPNIKLSTMAV